MLEITCHTIAPFTYPIWQPAIGWAVHNPPTPAVCMTPIPNCQVGPANWAVNRRMTNSSTHKCKGCCGNKDLHVGMVSIQGFLFLSPPMMLTHIMPKIPIACSSQVMPTSQSKVGITPCTKFGILSFSPLTLDGPVFLTPIRDTISSLYIVGACQTTIPPWTHLIRDKKKGKEADSFSPSYHDQASIC